MKLPYGDTERCFQSHLGLWAAEPLWLSQALLAIQSGMWVVQSRIVEIEAARRETRPYDVEDTVAILPMHGPMMKAQSKFGGVSTVRMRQMIRQAVEDKDVETILLHIDSPGGHVSGTQELADEVTRASQSKRIIGHVDDCCASAAYWVVSCCEYISCNIPGEVGSIGTIAILTDSSQKMDRAGIQVHVISTGKFKGIGVPGVSVSEEALAYIRERVESLNDHFQAAVMKGRKRTKTQMESLSDGRMFSADKAKALGLIDDIMSFDEALEKAMVPSKQKFSPHRVAMHERTLAAFRQRQGV